MSPRLPDTAMHMSQSNSIGIRACESSEAFNGSMKDVGAKKVISSEWERSLMLVMEIQKMILTFRDIIGLPPCDTSLPLHELVVGTSEDLRKLYPTISPSSNLPSKMKRTSINQGLIQLYRALTSIGDLWTKNHSWIIKFEENTEDPLENLRVEQLGQKVLAKLNYMINVAKDMFDVMVEDEKPNEAMKQGTILGDRLSKCYSYSKSTCPSSDALVSFLLEPTVSMELDAKGSYFPPHLCPLRLQALGKLKPADMKCLSFNLSPLSAHVLAPKEVLSKVVEEKNANNQKVAEEVSAKRPKIITSEGRKDSTEPNAVPEEGAPAPLQPLPLQPPPSLPPPPLTIPSPPSNSTSNGNSDLHMPPNPPSGGTMPMPPPPPKSQRDQGDSAGPPPPPIGAAKSLRPKKSNTKLQRSIHMGTLYRFLKGKVEGSSLNGKLAHQKRANVGGSGGGSGGGKLGMAAALAEMTKRSAYFQKIEDDVLKHEKSIKKIRTEINSFKTKDMTELIKFHIYVEQHLEELTDETQVLARFEGFPRTKLESLRTAAALYLKLQGIITKLENWKVAPPLAQQLDKVESYFNKMKGEVDTLERSKDEELKRLQAHNIQFDFNLLIRIKESMVDVSSNCMELAIKEHRETKEAANRLSGPKIERRMKMSKKMLWRAFQLAFRVYSFAGGQDDRADELSRELAKEIESCHEQA